MVPLLAALAIAACNAGGSYSLPGTSGQSVLQSNAMPEWQAKGLAQPVCPQYTGEPTCLALIQSEHGMNPNVAGWGPSDFQTRYNLPSATKGKGQIVAIVDAYDNPNVASDLQTYRKNFGLGKAKFAKYNQKGEKKNYPKGSANWGVEIDLDVQMVSAACPNCTIDLVEASSSNSRDLDTAEVEAVKLGAHIVSNSWICYSSNSCVKTKDYDQKGVVYLAGSGDRAYNHNGNPESLASVVSVGGTILSKSGSTYNETIWSGAGGGCSDNGVGSGGVKKPSWQDDPSCTFRTDADVSAVAWGVAEYDSYSYHGWITIGGTSVATPLTAGVFGLAENASKQNAGENFWKLKSKMRKHEMHYIKTGNDGQCSGSYLCTAGTKQFGTYSGPGGWGTPNGLDAY
jgi:subtilase family serine protease